LSIEANKTAAVTIKRSSNRGGRMGRPGRVIGL